MSLLIGAAGSKAIPSINTDSCDNDIYCTGSSLHLQTSCLCNYTPSFRLSNLKCLTAGDWWDLLSLEGSRNSHRWQLLDISSLPPHWREAINWHPLKSGSDPYTDQQFAHKGWQFQELILTLPLDGKILAVNCNIPMIKSAKSHLLLSPFHECLNPGKTMLSYQW